MLGYSDKEELFRLEGTEFLYANAEDRQKFVAEMEKHGFVRNFEFALKRKDGRQIHVIESTFASRAANGRVRYQGVLLDITEKIKLYDETRKAYDDLRRTQEQLLQSEKMSAVGRMISGVAHELNNPLTAISGYIQLLEAEADEPRAPHRAKPPVVFAAAQAAPHPRRSAQGDGGDHRLTRFRIEIQRHLSGKRF
jgi:PAS domain S-box-containing protein